MKKVLIPLFAFVLSALALAISTQPDSTRWPQGTQFFLLDASGNVLLALAPGQEPRQVPQDLLARAATLKVVLPDSTALEVQVTVEGKGEGLGEVKLMVDGKLVPLPELLHANGFTVQDGRIVRVKKEDKEGEEEVEEGKGKSSSPSEKGKREEQKGRGKGRP